ncbi:MAG: amidohydrolase family protein [Anaerolineales bacterium]|nr:amidohydrolase family protein [Anaerolineales bacterium]
MIIDAHYHLEERMEPLDALLEEMDQHGISRVALIPRMNEPFHVEGLAAKAGAILPGLLLGKLSPLGLILYRSTVTKDGKVSMLGKKYQLFHDPSNESVAWAMQSHPDRFYGWIFVNPMVHDPISELVKWDGQPGWIGVKTHPFWHRYPVALLDDVAAYCVDKDWPLLMHLGGDKDGGDYAYLPERHPRLKIIYAHAGLPFYKDVWEYVRTKEHVFIDFSNPVYVNDRVQPEAVKAVGAEKCIHGTDGPYLHAKQGLMLQKILDLPISQGEKDRILGGNFAELIHT